MNGGSFDLFACGLLSGVMAGILQASEKAKRFPAQPVEEIKDSLPRHLAPMGGQF